MSMEARAAFDKILAGGATATVAAEPVETDDARIARQNREALASWGLPGVAVPVV